MYSTDHYCRTVFPLLYRIYQNWTKDIMAMLRHVNDALGWAPDTVLSQMLTVLQPACPIFLLIFSAAAFTAGSVAATKPHAGITPPTTTGPGGRSLPATDPTRNFVKRDVHDDVTRTQKRVFAWVSAAAALTFVGNSVLVIARSLVMKKEHWWAGKSVVVRAEKSTPRDADVANPCQIYLIGSFFVFCLFLLAARCEALVHRGPSHAMDRRHRF
jgi:hypothetical protein